MQSLIIKDRRHAAGGKSTGNREKFLKRVKGTIQSSVHNIVNGSVGSTNSSGNVKVNQKTISEPTFIYMQGGPRNMVLPGNEEYVRGDEIDISGDGGGSGNGGAGQGGDGGEDDFTVEISRQEFLEFFFEDLELPNLQKTDDAEILEFSNKNAGFITDGPPSKLSILESKKKAKLRKMALTSGSRRKLKELDAELSEWLDVVEKGLTEEMRDAAKKRVVELMEKIAKVTEKIKRIPALEEIDLRYRSSTKVPVKHSSAVIFFIMDNSGSMGQEEKTLARKFFTLMYLFVRRKYGTAEVVFISHTDIAQEMTEEEFFKTRVSGGTLVSTALKLTSKIIKERYSSKSTNIYICQASDGDNWGNDNVACFSELAHNILPATQHYSYIQVGEHGFYHDAELWSTYSLISNHVSKFAAKKIRDASDIYPVFRDIFKKRSSGE